MGVLLKLPPKPTPVPKAFGPYEVLEPLGAGGMARVYRVRRVGPSGFAKEMVVKTLRPELAEDPRFVEMFVSEAKISAQLCHPHIVQVHDFGVLDGVPYLVMDHVDGRNLAQLQLEGQRRGQPLPLGIILAIARDLSAALAYAHGFVDAEGWEKPIIHRDVSASNVMIGRDGLVRLVDFGVATLLGEREKQTRYLVGKLAYTPPEVVRGAAADRRTDVFAFGALLHELLTARPLFAASSERATINRVLRLRVPPPSNLAGPLPDGLDEVVLRALHREPADRYPSAIELADALAPLSASAVGANELARYLGSLHPERWSVRCPRCKRARLIGGACPTCTPLRAATPTQVVLPLPQPRRAQRVMSVITALLAGLTVLATFPRHHAPSPPPLRAHALTGPLPTLAAPAAAAPAGQRARPRAARAPSRSLATAAPVPAWGTLRNPFTGRNIVRRAGR